MVAPVTGVSARFSVEGHSTSLTRLAQTLDQASAERLRTLFPIKFCISLRGGCLSSHGAGAETPTDPTALPASQPTPAGCSPGPSLHAECGDLVAIWENLRGLTASFMQRGHWLREVVNGTPSSNHRGSGEASNTSQQESPQ